MSGTFIYLVLLWGFIIFLLVMKAKKRNQSASDKTDAGIYRSGQRQSTGNTQKGTVRPKFPDMSGEARYFGTAPQQPVSSQAKHLSPPAVSKAAFEQEKDMSTTDYLRQKAAVDASAHTRDIEAERRRLYQETGGLPHGERFLPGDIVPPGKMMVICQYCGAENLLPAGTGQKTTCYFCREVLLF